MEVREDNKSVRRQGQKVASYYLRATVVKISIPYIDNVDHLVSTVKLTSF